MASSSSNDSSAETQLARQALNAETAKIPWRELQRFYAAGVVISVAPELDLVDIAWQLSQDNVSVFERLINQAQVAPVSDAQALQWYQSDAAVWAAVIKPWVLVQYFIDDDIKT